MTLETTRLPYTGPARPLSMSEWVERTADRAGMDEARAWTAMTAALGLLEKHAEPEAAQSLYDCVEGSERLARADEARPIAGGGLFGGIMKNAGGLSGQAMADAIGVLEQLKRRGVSKDDLKQLLPAAREALREAVGRDLLGDAIATVPGVGGLLGGDGQA